MSGVFGGLNLVGGHSELLELGLKRKVFSRGIFWSSGSVNVRGLLKVNKRRAFADLDTKTSLNMVMLED